jgi:gluconokinase
MRAIMEGICYSLYQVLNDMEEGGSSIDIIHASGGFIQSVTWLQMLSDIFNKKVIVSLAADASAMGAAFLAMHSLGIITEWDEVKGMVETSDTYCPAEDAHERYQRNFKVFKGLYSKLKDDMAVLSAMA